MSARVLIVEDEALIADDLRRTLSKLGYEALEPAASGEAAVRAAREERPDLVLMDIRLAGVMDGIEAAREIRRRFDLPIVFLTSHSDDATVARAKGVEPYGYVLKPFAERELSTTIEIALHKHRADARVAAQRRWFSTTLESLADAVIATDPAGTISFLNAAAEKLTGWKREEAVGLPVAEVFRVSDADGAPIDCPIRAAMRSSSPVGLPAVATLAAKDGRVLTIDDTAAPILDDAGILLGGVVVFRDVTEKRALEQRLVQAERLATIGTLSAGIAHEINNPLTYVVGNVSLALESLRESSAALQALALSGPSRTLVEGVRARLTDLQDLLRDAGEGAERVRQIVSDLRRFARPSEQERRLLDLRTLLEGAVKMTSHVVRHHARLRAEYGATPPVDAAEGSLVQVFTNLLLNAAQAVPTGDAEHHEIVLRSYTDAQQRAVVEVKDSGRGIPRQALERIFEPFFTTKPGGSGMGLGLAICRSIVTSYGGDITAESEVGVGSTFRVVLPPASEERAEESPAAAPEGPAPRGRVLVVDDEAAVGGSIQRMLRHEHDVTVVTEGRDALARIDAGERFDLVLCDIMMPAMSGMDLYEAIALRHPEQARRFVFMTGGTFNPSASDFVARVPNTVLSKPFTLEAIRRLARDHVG